MSLTDFIMVLVLKSICKDREFKQARLSQLRQIERYFNTHLRIDDYFVTTAFCSCSIYILLTNYAKIGMIGCRIIKYRE